MISVSGTLRFLRVVIVGGFTAILLDTCAIQLPRAVYILSSPSTKKECARIRTGSSRKEVLTLIRSVSEPDQQFERDGRLYFLREDGGCVVEFDPGTQFVRQARFDPGLRVLGPRDQ